MEKNYKNIYIFFIGVLLVLIWGFYKSYIVYFPTFEGGYLGGSYNYIQHTHGALMLTWILFLTIQPILIKRKLYNIHRTIGKISYFIVPMLLFSIFLVTKTFYYRTLTYPNEYANTEKDAIGTITGLAYIAAFAIFYLLAISNKRNIPNHIRYMIGTSLLLINPGLSRALFYFFGMAESGLAVSDYVAFATIIVFIIYDYRNKKDYRPHIVILSGLIILHLIWLCRYTEMWQTFGRYIVRHLF
jgi:hypothetical protein